MASARTPAFRHGETGEVKRMGVVSSGVSGMLRWADLLFACIAWGR
jgi:hypothetical protein